ncbi:uncharacterized protein FRV6_16939 [Fusarium oxysporum]|uniref:Major facilitator superfamily (MFS) profile domain-containing protein n=1 Tax=Fusarium oxysporum TaxID=5507 RepID=A0A2H3U4D4_FUSOX|nr:uncharacterized protein FRV6_16939 [Fusarium oxysporum]
MGIGGSICQNCAISYFAMYATDSQSPLLYGIMSGLWAIGLVVGGPVGSAFVQNSATTWRWAFFINLPFLGLAIICALTFVPGRPESNNLPLRDRLADIDILGIALQVATTVLFAIAATFSGPLRSYQKRPGHQVVPITIMARRHMIPLWVASGCAGATVNHYGLIYLAGGAITLGSAIALATTLAPNVSENRMEGAALLNMSLMGGISMALIIAGAVYENRGMSLLKSALGSFDYDEGDLREALAGVSRDTGGGDEAHRMIAYGADATCKAIALLFYIVASSGALCLACGVLAVFGRSRAKKSQ